jgi:hypothetical protein
MVAQMAREFRGARFSLRGSNSAGFRGHWTEGYGYSPHVLCCEAFGLLLHAWLAGCGAMERAFLHLLSESG